MGDIGDILRDFVENNEKEKTVQEKDLKRYKTKKD